MAALRAALRYPKTFEWAALAVMAFLTWRYFSLVDDSFIYFRYVDNAVLLHRGLVFNGGEYVEGFTSPLWTLWLMPWRALGLDYWTIIRWTSLGFAALLWASLVWVNRTLTRETHTLNLPLAITVAHYGVLSSLSSGLESPFVILMASAYAVLALRPTSKVFQALASLAPMVRHELAIPWLVYCAWLSWRTRRIPWVLGLGCAVTLGGWLLFRVYYYAELLPNTFYLKDDVDPLQGFAYVQNALAPQQLLVVGALVSGMAAFIARRTKDGLPHNDARWLMLTASAASLVYVIRVGGDMLYYRFAAFPLGLALFTASGVVERFVALHGWDTRAKWAWPAAAVLVGLLSFFALPYQLKDHPIHPKAAMVKWHGISDLAWHRSHKTLKWTRGRATDDAKLRDDYAHTSPEQWTQSKIRVTGWCRTAFDRFDQYIVHKWGLTEPVLARTRVPSDRPGHKSLLHPLADDLARLRKGDPQHRSVGFFRRAVATGDAPPWIVANLPSLGVLERKMYNRHRWSENIDLAFTKVAPIVLPAKAPK